jgi:hypothetical protein
MPPRQWFNQETASYFQPRPCHCPAVRPVRMLVVVSKKKFRGNKKRELQVMT